MPLASSLIFSPAEITRTPFFQLGFIDGAVIAVPGKAVKPIDQNALKGVLVAVGNHALELGPAVRGAALRPVNVLSDHDMAVVFGILIASLELSLDGLLGLTVAGIAGVNYNVHCIPPPLGLSAKPLSNI